jgi:hypothetical protein
MPIKQCQLNGKPGYKWGDGGKCYTDGTVANQKKKALAQGIAMGDIVIKKRKRIK